MIYMGPWHKTQYKKIMLKIISMVPGTKHTKWKYKNNAKAHCNFDFSFPSSSLSHAQ